MCVCVCVAAVVCRTGRCIADSDAQACGSVCSAPAALQLMKSAVVEAVTISGIQRSTPGAPDVKAYRENSRCRLRRGPQREKANPINQILSGEAHKRFFV